MGFPCPIPWLQSPSMALPSPTATSYWCGCDLWSQTMLNCTRAFLHSGVYTHAPCFGLQLSQHVVSLQNNVEPTAWIRLMRLRGGRFGSTAQMCARPIIRIRLPARGVARWCSTRLSGAMQETQDISGIQDTKKMRHDRIPDFFLECGDSHFSQRLSIHLFNCTANKDL